jgi:hypothetical protein
MSLKLYLISCDLMQAGAGYESLRERLRSLDARQVLESQWVLRSSFTAAELKDIFRQLMDDRDRIVVTEIGGEWASRRALVNLGEA